MRTPSITVSGYTSPQHTDVQATWRKFGWKPQSELKAGVKVIDMPVKLLLINFERVHANDKYIGPVPSNVKPLHREGENHGI